MTFILLFLHILLSQLVFSPKHLSSNNNQQLRPLPNQYSYTYIHKYTHRYIAARNTLIQTDPTKMSTFGKRTNLSRQENSLGIFWSWDPNCPGRMCPKGLHDNIQKNTWMDGK